MNDPGANKGNVNENWLKEYLQKEQEINLKRLEQQEHLLNITETLLQDVTG